MITYRKTCILDHHVEENIHEKLPTCDTIRNSAKKQKSSELNNSFRQIIVNSDQNGKSEWKWFLTTPWLYENKTTAYTKRRNRFPSLLTEVRERQTKSDFKINICAIMTILRLSILFAFYNVVEVR